MGSMVLRSERRRGRKRKREDGENVPVDHEPKKRVLETRSKALVGRYIKKEFDSGAFLGKVVFYDAGLYRVDYEDGDCADLETSEVKEFLIGDIEFDDNLMEKMKKLDELVLNKTAKDVQTEHPTNVLDSLETCSLSDLSAGFVNEVECVKVDDGEADADSSSDSCEYAGDMDVMVSKVEVPLSPPPELPPSSGTICIPEQYVSHLLSVYGFLCSFSIRLFLSPFGLDDFVGSLNCSVPNTLLDSIHVSLMRTLRRHLETLSSDGSELASKCLRCVEWSLIDSLTWPVYLIEYLIVMGYAQGPDWKGFYIGALEREYYTISAGRKLMILQILCDDVLDCEELRSEIDMREELELGTDPDDALTAPENGSVRAHPRYSKTSACKDLQKAEILEENTGTKFASGSSSIGFRGIDPGADFGFDQDGNVDECRLCGMDGTLLCCDGCPSAYHSRCIGLTKLSIPEGEWYCPECTINKIGPTITKGSSLRGASIFGVDLYGQIFLGTCNHLLVLQSSMELDSCIRYYNPNDIPTVLQALQSSTECIAIYSEICKAIFKYWDIADVSSISDRAGMGTNLKANKKENIEFDTASLTFSGNKLHNAPKTVEGDICYITESGLQNVEVTCRKKQNREPGIIDTVTFTVPHTNHSGHQMNIDTASEQACSRMGTILVEQITAEPTISAASISQQGDPSKFIQQNLFDKSSLMENNTGNSRNSNDIYRGALNSMSVEALVPSQWKKVNDGIGGRATADCFYLGTSFRCNGYINNYIHGDFAASAAANLVILSSEENQVSESRVSDKSRKVMSANVSLQTKAFSSAAARFFWPHSEKKLVEGPRERCGWCLSCKAPVTSKKGCLLNAAASNAIKGATKTLSRLHPVKNGDVNLSGITTYIMLLEESLCGLTSGPFLNASYRLEWRRQLEQATTLCPIKFLLLQLEENIRTIAFSADWFKLVDIWSVESLITQNAATTAGSTQKRGRGGRRGRKPSAVSEVANEEQDILTDFSWWRGGMPSRLVFKKGALPCPMIKKAARHGASRNIPGIYYSEGSEIPLRSRQLVWRAAVEMSRNTSQLALQVRFLDHHLRWSDLVRPDQIIQDGKGSETEASAFRNASICDKKFVENSTKYGVVFANQKHLPSRVMKNVIEIEQNGDGSEKYWLCEMQIPLYLIKDYEETTGKVTLSSADKPRSVLSKLQRRQYKAYPKDIFSYLVRKRDYMDRISCASCPLVLLLGDAVQCITCQGYYHKNCTVSSTVYMNGEIEFQNTCKQCSLSKVLTKKETINESPTSPLPLQGKDFQNALHTSVGKQVEYNQPLASGGIIEHEMKTHKSSNLASKSKRKLCSWGLIWKKKGSEDAGIDFRTKNILLKGYPDRGWLRPECHLCHKPYNSDLNYIRCETCQNWYHADAVELEESKISDLAGFKCCRCRRIKSPICPYLDPEIRKQLEGKKPRTRAPKQGSVGVEPESGVIVKQLKGDEPALLVPKVEDVREADPLLFSLSMDEQFSERNSIETTSVWTTAPASGPLPQKLPIRRQTMLEKDEDSFFGHNASHFESSSPLEGNTLNSMEESLPHVEWDTSTNGIEDQMMFDYGSLDYDDMETQPQMYFSFTELLASDDGGQNDGVDQSGDVAVNWKSSSVDLQEGACDTTYDQQDPMINVDPTVDVVVPCKMCSFAEPRPDLFCQICGLWMHSECSPWVEESLSDGGWRCGSCRA